MATTTPSPPPTSPHEEVENDNQQPLISCSQPPASVTTPSSPIEDVGHDQQFANSNSPPQTSVPQQPESLVDRQQHPQPEDVEDQQEPPVPPSPSPEDKILDHQQTLAPPSPSLHSQPPSPPLIGDEHPPENLNPNLESSLSKQPMSPSTSPTEPEEHVESPNYRNSPSPSPNPNPNPIPNPDHESPTPSSPPHQSSFQSPSATTLEGNPSPKSQQSPNDPSPSPPPIAASPSSPQDTLEPNTDLKPPTAPSGVPLVHTVTNFSPSTPQTSLWTHQETANLIQAYQEKWYSQKKGPLKASQWEEVAITVAARCGYDEPTKSAKQCGHKIEKLRKRYRAERGKPRSKATAWNFFKLMDNLEKGPLPTSSSQPMALIEYQNPSNSNGKKRKNDDSDGEYVVNNRSSRSKSSNHHIANGGLTGNLRFSDGGSERVRRGLRTPVVRKRKGFYQEDDGEEEEEEAAEGSEDEEEEDGVAAQLAAEIKGFAERFVKMENKKIEMMRDTERYRMEVEKKRMEMILESQQMLVECVNKAFSSSHKTQKLPSN